MIYRILAELVLLAHAAFILFAVLGGLLVLWKRRVMPWHLAALAWGAAIMGGGWICPLTPLENHFRHLAGAAGYMGGFIEHYVFGLIYPEGLTRKIQIALAGALIATNMVIYTIVYRRCWRSRGRRPGL
ncbi:DUF2784 family protein [Bordetella petrii]|nr:DUF2784 family protein [Bordetella petrii]